MSVFKNCGILPAFRYRLSQPPCDAFSYLPCLFMDTLLSVSSFSSKATSPFPGQNIPKHARQKHHHTCWLPSKQAKQITCSQHSLSFSKLTSSWLSSPTPKLDWRCPTSWWVPKRKELTSRQNWCNPVSLVCFSYHFSVYKIANQLFKKINKKNHWAFTNNHQVWESHSKRCPFKFNFASRTQYISKAVP